LGHVCPFLERAAAKGPFHPSKTGPEAAASAEAGFILISSSDCRKEAQKVQNPGASKPQVNHNKP